MEIRKFGLSLKVIPVIACRSCSATERSDQLTLEILGDHLEDIPDLINLGLATKFVQPAIGWAVNGNGNYTCPNCLEKGKKSK